MRRFFRAERRDIELCFGDMLTELLRGTQMRMSGRFIQHGDTSVLLHSVAVAYYSYKLSRRLRLTGDRRALIRGALLHDYFLYDWHQYNNEYGLHGFSHPATALRNARRDTNVSPLEADIISRHMFPLTLTPPKSREGWVICLVDKICSVYETFNRGIYPELRSYLNRCRLMTSQRTLGAAA